MNIKQLYEILDIEHNINLGECITHIGEEYENFPQDIKDSYDKLQKQLGLDVPEYANKGTYKLTFVVNAESLDQAIDILDQATYKEKLKYITKE